jgi:dTDP-glucose 4,6-dehydratase
MEKIFVTGGAGFIGSAFIRQVLGVRPDIEIINFDALTYAGNLENLSDVTSPRHRFVKGDIRNLEAVLSALPEGCDAVFNFAAESHVDRSIESATEFITTNILGTQLLLDAARKRNTRRFIQVSTDEVMGTLPDDSEELFTEHSPIRPNSPYAASKASAEHLVRAARETFGVDTVITRCGNNYGPRQFPEKLIPLVIANSIAGEKVPVYGDGGNVRDWIFVEDHARAVWLAYEKGAPGGAYNIGARNEKRNIDVVRSILEILDRPESLIEFVTDRPGHDRRYAIDPKSAETELGWSPQTDWTRGLAMTIDWYRTNPEWVANVRSGEYLEYYARNYANR